MPVISPSRRRYRGREIVMLRRLNKVVDEILRHNTRYPQGAPPAQPNRRHLDFTNEEIVNMTALTVKATALLHAMWPPPT